MRRLILAGLCLALCITPAFAYDGAGLPTYDDDQDMPYDHNQPPASGLPLPQFDGQEQPETANVGIMASMSDVFADMKRKFIADYYTAYPDGFSGWYDYGTYTAEQAVGWDYLREILDTETFDAFFEAYQEYSASYESGGKLIVWKYFDWYFTTMKTQVILLGEYKGYIPVNTLHYSYAYPQQFSDPTDCGNWWNLSGTGRARCLYTWPEQRGIPNNAHPRHAEGFELEIQIRQGTTEVNPSKQETQWRWPHALGWQDVTISDPNAQFGPRVGIFVGYYHWEPSSANKPIDNAIGGWPFVEQPPVARHASTITKHNPLYFEDEIVNWEYVRHFGRENIPVIHSVKDAYDKLQGDNVYWFYLIYSTEKKRTPQVSLFGVAFYGGTPDDVPSKINLSPKKHILISSVGDFQFYTDDPNDYYPPGAGYLAYNLFPADSKRPDGKYTAASDNIGLRGLLCDFIPKDVTYIYKAGRFVIDAEVDIPPAYNPPGPDTDLIEGDTGPEDNMLVAFLRRLFVPDPNMIIDKISLESAVSGFTSPVFALVAGFNDVYNFAVHDGFPKGIVLWGTDFADVLNPIFRKTFLVPIVNTEFSLFSLSRVLSGVALTGMMMMSLISTLLSFFTGGRE